jgi:hypothetical protein
LMPLATSMALSSVTEMEPLLSVSVFLKT